MLTVHLKWGYIFEGAVCGDLNKCRCTYCCFRYANKTSHVIAIILSNILMYNQYDVPQRMSAQYGIALTTDFAATPRGLSSREKLSLALNGGTFLRNLIILIRVWENYVDLQFADT